MARGRQLQWFVSALPLASRSRPAQRLRIAFALLATLFALAAPPVVAQMRAGYVGDAACTSCHRQASLSYQHTAHHLTSQLPSADSLPNRFFAGENLITIIAPENDLGEPSLVFRMSHTGSDYSETAITGFDGQFHQHSARIDIVTGSGKRGQTFLNWQQDQLFELPVSYWTDGRRWINSPGYDDGTANFSRPIYPACMECHATYLRPLFDDPESNHFDRASLVVGIGCEVCHGPGAQHIALEAARPTGSPRLTDSAILNPAHFTRERQIDLCALCHNGIQRQPLEPAFSYLPGEPLSRYFQPLDTPAAEHPDVHGNQVALLERSRCFRESTSMTCSTCHDTHAIEQPADSYSTKCLSCHRWQQCGEAKHIGAPIKSQCIRCHMPVEPTTVIVSTTAGKQVNATMRNHWIKVYPTAKPIGTIPHS